MDFETLSLIKSAHASIVQAQRQPDMVDMSTTLENLRVVMNEVELRSNVAFFSDYCTRGESLLNESFQSFGAELSDLDVSRSGADAENIQDATDIDSGVSQLSQALAEVVARLSEYRQCEDLIERIVAWEIELLAYRMTDTEVEVREADANTELSAETFTSYMGQEHPDWENFEAKAVLGIAGGFSKVTNLVRGSDSVHGEREIIVRSEPSKPMLDLEGMFLSAEYPVVKLAYEAGIPVPEPYFLEPDHRHFGTPFCAMQRMPGEILGTFEGSEHAIDEAMLKAVIRLIVDIEQVKVDPENPLIQQSHLQRWAQIDSLRENTRELIRYWYEVGLAGGGRPSPLLERTYHWLLDNAPQDESPGVLIHGDVGFHNILFHEGSIAAILDWENARFGDPAEDLSLFIASTANQVSRNKIIQWYEEAGGESISDYRLRYFEVFHCFKIIVAGSVSLQRVNDAPRENLHLAVFGLRYVHHSVSEINNLIRVAESAIS